MAKKKTHSDHNFQELQPTVTREGLIEVYMWDTLYRMNLHLLYGPIGDEAFAAWMKRKNMGTNFASINRSHAASTRRIVDVETGGMRAFVITFPHKWKRTPEHILTLTHEMLHVTSGTLRRIGIELSDETEEAFCYHQEMLIREFGNAMDKKPVPYTFS